MTNERTASTNGSGERIAYFPPVKTESELLDLLSRAAWFLTFSSIEKITVPILDARLADRPWKVAPEMDPAIAERLGVLRRLVELRPVSSPTDVEEIVAQATIVLRWNEAALSEAAPAGLSDDWLRDKRVFRVDPQRTRYEGSHYIEVSSLLMQDKTDVVARSHARLQDLARVVGTRSCAYVLATGPSVGSYHEFEYENALTVVCNSVILNEELMRRVQPQVLVFADPIFHFGPSRYAAAFRRSLREAASKFDFAICIPIKYHAILSAAIPDLAHRIIAVPARKEREFNFDLLADFEVKMTANVLTYLMLPLASTFADQIGILGCDGRPLEENTYFWRHNESTQISEEMANIRAVHPAFFDIDYNDYYLDHCRTLDEALAAGEASGRRFESLGFSYIPALSRRTSPTNRGEMPRGSATVALIDPDALDWSGHFMAYNDKLAAALAADGHVVTVICNSRLDEEILRMRPHFRPRLAVHSWSIGNRLPDPTELASCEAELLDAVEELVTGKPLIVYMYTGSVDHATMLVKLAEREPTVHVHVNLFWAAFHDDRWDEWVERYAPALRRLAQAPRTTITVPTEGLRSAIFEAVGVAFEVARHPSTAVADADFDRLRAGTRSAEDAVTSHGDDDAPHVLFPGNPRQGKGFDATVATAELLAEQGLRSIIRYLPQSGDPHHDRIRRLAGEVEVVTGELENNQFLELFHRSAVAVLPYESSAFANRTSGLLIDAIYHGLPVVAIRGTWLATVVETYGCGVVAEDASAPTLARAIRQVLDDHLVFGEKASEAARAYFAENSWTALAASIVRGRRPAVPDVRAVVSQSAMPEGASSNGRSRVPDASEAIGPLIGPLDRSAAAAVDESHVVATILRDRRDSTAVMIDVGAHHGSSLVPFADMGWTVLACEPDESNRAALLERVGERSNVIVDPRAVGDVIQREVAFFSSDESTGISGLLAFRPSHRRSATVEVTTVSALVESHELTSIDFLKIDVEGYELNVLRGVPWEKLCPDVIACEFEDAKTSSLGQSYRDLADYLVDRGYTVYLSEWHPVIRYGVSHDWRTLVRYPAPLGSPNAWGNILAFRQDPGAAVVTSAFETRLKRKVMVEAPSIVADAPAATTVATPEEEPLARSGGQDVHEAGKRRWRRAARGEESPTPSMTPQLVLPENATLYDRFYVWARSTRPLLFSLGQFVMWCARQARGRPVWTLSYLLLIAALIALGFSSADATYGPLSWAIATALTLAAAFLASTGFAISRLNLATQDSEQLNSRLRRRLDVAEKEFRSGATATNARLDTLESQIQRVGALSGAVEALRTEMGQEHQALDRRLDDAAASMRAALDAAEVHAVSLQRVASTQEAAERRLGELRVEASAIGRRLETAESSLSAGRSAEVAQSAELREIRAEQRAVDSRVGELRAEQTAREERLRTSLRELQTQVGHSVVLRDHVEALRAEIEATHLALRQRLEAAEEALRAEREAVKAQDAALRKLKAEQSALARPVEELRSEQRAHSATIDELQSERAVIFDVVSTLRKLRPLWEGRPPAEGDLDTHEHGHALLMSLLVREAAAEPDALTNKTLVEIGMTRERDPRQSSTEKLAVFSALMGMHFTSVDMDSANTARADRMIRPLNPDAEFITARGEDYLVGAAKRLDYVYLDAFDFDHGQHSRERLARYREVLDREITNEASWQMHLTCAAALVKTLSDDGIVVIDDTWADDNGEFQGKGTLAVPLLLSSGFAVAARSRRAIALRRTGERSPSTTET